MWTTVLFPLAAALVAGLMAWNHASRIDRQSPAEVWHRNLDSDGSLLLAVGALVAAVVAFTILQVRFLSF